MKLLMKLFHHNEDSPISIEYEGVCPVGSKISSSIVCVADNTWTAIGSGVQRFVKDALNLSADHSVRLCPVYLTDKGQLHGVIVYVWSDEGVWLCLIKAIG